MSRPPNILWIVTTQWRAQACGYAGDPNVSTPHLDAFARESVNYTQAVTPHPFGPFARAALLTGIPSPQNGIRDYFDPLPIEARTVAHSLGERGYATAFFGKWHLGQRDPHAPLVGETHARTLVPPEARGGFEWWEGFESGFLLNDPLLHGTRMPQPARFPGYQSDVVCDRAKQWTTRTGPWFCVVSLEPPHPPYDAPSAGVLPGNPDTIVLPRNVPTEGEVAARARTELAGYYAHIEATDHAIGRLIAGMATENTVIVFTSVHGDMHGAHGLFRKGWPYEESVRVPLLVCVPGVFAQEDSAAISLLDLPAMSVNWAEGKTSGLARLEAAISMPSVVALPHQCDRIWRGVRTSQRKLVLDAEGAPWLFFDLERDPWEMRNLATEISHARELAALQERITLLFHVGSAQIRA
jgi:arylsulfatase A-like enzyme